MDLSRIKSEFPAESFRGHQEHALEEIRAAFERGNEVVLVRAPTGSGKSLIARAVAGCSRRPGDDGDGEFNAFYTTPQVSQLNDVQQDPLLSEFQITRGKNNYDCVHPDVEDGVPVGKAPCCRDDNFNCAHYHRCPFYQDKEDAQDSRFAATTLAYFMHLAGTETFDVRDVMVIDEAHGLPQWAELYGTIELSPRTVPEWESVEPSEFDSVEEAAGWANEVRGHLLYCKRRLQEDRLTPEGAMFLDRVKRLERELGWFLDEYQDPASDSRWLFEQGDGSSPAVQFKPVSPERLLYHSVWERANHFCLLSATILNRAAFCRNVGLSPSDVALVDIDHTFPLENRPLYDVMQGPMTWDDRDETLPKIAETVGRLMDKHNSDKGLIHCHSYAIQSALEDYLKRDGRDRRLRSHDKEDRNTQLQQWKRSNRPEVFLSVKMEEALDLEGDLCRWQVLCKTPYPNGEDPQVELRLDNGEWAWYWRKTLKTVIQACGRIVRAPDDYGATYLADSSFEDLFKRARHDMPDWFEAQVENMRTPNLRTHQSNI